MHPSSHNYVRPQLSHTEQTNESGRRSSCLDSTIHHPPSLPQRLTRILASPSPLSPSYLCMRLHTARLRSSNSVVPTLYTSSLPSALARALHMYIPPPLLLSSPYILQSKIYISLSRQSTILKPPRLDPLQCVLFSPWGQGLGSVMYDHFFLLPQQQ
jgi:hypothetical protein